MSRLLSAAAGALVGVLAVYVLLARANASLDRWQALANDAERTARDSQAVARDAQAGWSECVDRAHLPPPECVECRCLDEMYPEQSADARTWSSGEDPLHVRGLTTGSNLRGHIALERHYSQLDATWRVKLIKDPYPAPAIVRIGQRPGAFFVADPSDATWRACLTTFDGIEHCEPTTAPVDHAAHWFTIERDPLSPKYRKAWFGIDGVCVALLIGPEGERIGGAPRFSIDKLGGYGTASAEVAWWR